MLMFMQPQQSTGLPEGYDFLQNTPKPKKRILPGGNSKKERIIIFGGGLALLLILFIIVSSVIGSLNKPKTELLLTVVQDQQEIIRVAEMGVKKSKGSASLNYSANLLETVKTDQTATIKLLSGVKLNNKLLGARLNSKTDDKLNSAEQTNKFDEVFLETMHSILTTYQKDLKTAHSQIESKKTRVVLEKAFNNTQFFLPSTEENKEADTASSTPQE